MIQGASVKSMKPSSDIQNHQQSQSGTQSSPSLRNFDDDTLMIRAQNGDKEAFEVIISRHMDFTIAVAARFLADQELGTDVAQDVFFELWKNRLKYQPEGKFKAYLSTLLLNRCRDATRRRGSEQRRRDGWAHQPLEAPKNPSDQAILGQSSLQLNKALEKLEPSDREILVMRYGLDMAYDEIAESTGKPAGTLRSRVFHCLRKLRKTLEGES